MTTAATVSDAAKTLDRLKAKRQRLVEKQEAKVAEIDEQIKAARKALIDAAGEGA